MIKIGWATRDFTPDRPALVRGQVNTRIGRKAIDPLTLTACAVENEAGGEQALIISCDLAAIDDALLISVRKRMSSRLPEFPPEKLILCATHTHTSLVLVDGQYPHPGGDVMTSDECLTLVSERAAEAAAEAWEKRAPCLAQRAFGHAVVGHNRRAVYADGSSAMYGKTNRADFVSLEGCEDHSLDMLFAWDTSGRLTGILLVVPCPSQVTESLSVWSADYWHEVRQELRARFGDQLFIAGLCGAAGDQSPHFLLYAREEEEMRKRRGITERREIAQRIGDAVARALQCTVPTAGEPALAHRVGKATLSMRKITAEDRAWAEKELDQMTAQGVDSNGWVCRSLRAIMESEGTRAPAPFIAEVHALRIGDLAIVTTPFELFLDYGFRIKARSPAPQTAVVQLACGSGMYLPTARGIRGGGYSGSLLVAPVGPEGGAELVEHSLKMISGLW